ncbi:MAG: hypothetical protein WKH64_10350 [Chloroflexia bacterium]
MRYAHSIVAGAAAGAVCAPAGAVFALIFSDISGWGLLFSLNAVTTTLPIVLLFGAVLGALLGYSTARVFRR